MHWRNRISAAAWVVVRDAHLAEDIFQKVTLKALACDVTFESEGALLSWAFISARREGIDWLRKKGREAATLAPHLLDVIDNEWRENAVAAGMEKLEALKGCLEATPSESQMLLRLRYAEGLRCELIAKQLSVKVDAVYKRLSRLHEMLRQCIDLKLNATTPARRSSL
jgi:RNA polymerase sigma-70 factor (ECF subfamily)